MRNFGSLLKKERERLKLTQEKFARLCGVGLRSQTNYESNKRAPDADYLYAAVGLGCDINFLFSGIRHTKFEEDVLVQCVEMLESALTKTGKRLSATQKAKVIGVLYDELTDENASVNSQSVERHLKLVS